jgi:hypothetical protein
MVVRTILNGNGCFVIPDDSIHIDAVSTGAANGYAGFKVTSQGVTGISYTGGSTQTITWDVVGTDAAPVSASEVSIYMSVDGGNTWSYFVGNFPNTGTASVTVPNPAATSSLVRFKVKGSGNVFFNVNLKNITVTHDSGIPTSTGVQQVGATLDNLVNVYPVPANELLHISVGSLSGVDVVIFNAVGQNVWTGAVGGNMVLPVAAWAKGIYYAKFRDMHTGAQAIKSFIVN